MKKKSIMFLTMMLSILFSAITSSCIVNADELDGYTKVDWEWNRDVETTEDNSVIVGGNIMFWRYVDPYVLENNNGNTKWNGDFGNELTDEEVFKIWDNKLPPKYIVASVDVKNIPDESIRNYIYNHIDEDLPHLKFKFDIDADVEGDDPNYVDGQSFGYEDILEKGKITGEVIFEDGDTYSFNGEKSLTKTYTFASNSGKALIGDNETEYKYERYEMRKNEEVTDDGTEKHINLVLSEDDPQRILYVYVIPNNTTPTPAPSSQEDEIEIDTVPIDPPICDRPTSTIEWEEKTKHTVYDNDGRRYTCYPCKS